MEQEQRNRMLRREMLMFQQFFAALGSDVHHVLGTTTLDLEDHNLFPTSNAAPVSRFILPVCIKGHYTVPLI